mgnify:FL=1
MFLFWLCCFRLTVHMNAFHLSINDTLHSGLGKEVSELQSAINQPMPVDCLPNMAPVCIIASRKLVENIGFLKIQVSEFFHLVVTEIGVLGTT